MKHYDTERASTIAVDGDAVTITVRYDGGAWVAEYVMRGCSRSLGGCVGHAGASGCGA